MRVKSKFARWKDDERIRFPVVLSKNSLLSKAIISDYHEIFLHAGCYRILTELRRAFWIPHFFSVVKGILKDCVTCRKSNRHTIKLNQSSYRDFRLNPPEIPFRSIALDHLGHYFVKYGGKKIKVWILCISCLWTRAINLKICLDLSTKEFLRALQLHSSEYGVPEYCMSDHGSSFVAGANVIKDFLRGSDVQDYFEECGVKSFTFEHYPKGCHPLGGLVETCVKMVRQLLRSSIKNYVLDMRDFEFAVAQATHMVNRRPIAFQESLRDESENTIPDPITPEKLIHGFDLLSVNLIPELQSENENDPDWPEDVDVVDNAQKAYGKLKKVRANMSETYHSEFLSTLMKQAVNVKSRYKPVTHHRLEKGDIVMVKEDCCKPMNYPMAIVKDSKVII